MLNTKITEKKCQKILRGGKMFSHNYSTKYFPTPILTAKVVSYGLGSVEHEKRRRKFKKIYGEKM